ncbi:NAD+ kinase [Arcanobacterium pluranimalium]|uniref:NAD kinase n=1 Tax=Arcanobacterium pluranimalium TaxID=108028 RepID=UPI0030845C9D|nr:NAD+ kinase [Arcanobacterium pluranimalium]
MTRQVALVKHASRADILESVDAFETEMNAAGFEVIDIDSGADFSHAELVVVFGGDGTILRAVEETRAFDIPVIGINYGHVGFLAEAEPNSLSDLVQAISARRWTVDQRMTIDVTVRRPDGSQERSWALNETSIEKDARSRMIETDLAVDGRGVSSFKADAVLMSTPTGSTAYNFSAGGPIVWPNVEAILLVPIAAHALFTRPMVVGPASELDVQIRSDDALVWCDGRRCIEAPAGTVISVRRGEKSVRLARIHDTPFSGRLVAKFDLPVQGWRNRREDLP